ncbi:MAG: hypothetical protein AB7S26_00900 [Sandaracinaceae bacterium]
MTDSLKPEPASETGLDPDLEEWLAVARDADREAPPGDLDALWTAVEREQRAADTSKRFWIQSRPTWVRRSIAGLTALSVIAVGGLGSSRADLAELPLRFLISAVGALAFLLGASVWLALRPLHRPPLPRAAHAAMVALTLGSTFALALLAPDGDDGVPHTTLLHEMVSPCLFYGLFMGLPVYLVLRLVDRGPALSSLIAACAAGLAGNLVLQLHCPRHAPEHLMAAHFTVAVLFVVGLLLVHVAVGRLKSGASSR